MNEIDWDSLISDAMEARGHSYAPYSKFAVGAALLTKTGKVFTGCNVENLSFGLTICAERNALFASIAQGINTFNAIAIVADTETPISPCGACRQVLAEFGDLLVLSANLQREQIMTPLSVLLPRASAGILNRPEQ